MQGGHLIINGIPNWCPQYLLFDQSSFIVATVDEQSDGMNIESNNFATTFASLAVIYVILDMTWILCVWSAACVGTPTQPMGRDEYLRWALWCVYSVHKFRIAFPQYRRFTNLSSAQRRYHTHINQTSTHLQDISSQYISDCTPRIWSIESCRRPQRQLWMWWWKPYFLSGRRSNLRVVLSATLHICSGTFYMACNHCKQNHSLDSQ